MYYKLYIKYFLILTIALLSITSGVAQQFGFVSQGGGNSSSTQINGVCDNRSTKSFYAVGYFSSTAVFGSESVTSLSGTDAFIIQYDNSGREAWVRGTRSSGAVDANRVASDSDGNVYIAGHYNSNTQFGGSTTLTYVANWDVFLAKYDRRGNFLWAKALNGTGEHECWGLAVDSKGAAYISGLMIGDLTFKGSTISSAGGGLDMFLAKFDSDGTPAWIQTTTSTGQENATGISITSDDKIYLTGFISANTSFGGKSVTASGGLDVFLAEYDTDGNCSWAISDGGGADEVVDAITTDTQGNIYLAGRFDGSPSNFSGNNISTTGNFDMLLLKYNSTGVFQWVKSIGSTSADQANSVACDSSDNVFITGQFLGNMTVGGTPYTHSGSGDAIFSKISSDGTLQWIKTVGGSGGESGGTVFADKYGTATFGGYFTSTVSFGSNSKSAGAGNRNSFVANLFVPVSPDISSSDVVSDNPFTALASSGLSEEGNSAVTAKGFVWSTDPSPTTALSTRTRNASGLGDYTDEITGLTFNTTYYIRSYAINAQGTFYGDETSFKTGNYPVSLDGNQDYELDSLQDNVVTLLSDVSDSYITVVGPSGSQLDNVSVSDYQENGYLYPFGRLALDIAGSKADITVIYHGQEFSDIYTYRKDDGRGGIYIMPDADFRNESYGSASAMTVSFTLYDGGDGDSDNIINGIIRDPGGPAVPNTSATIPVWDWWWALLLISLGGVAWSRKSKYFL